MDTLGRSLSSEERESQLNKRLENTHIQLRQLTRENGLLEQRIDQLETDKNAQQSQISDLRSQVDNITGQAMSEQSRLDRALKDKAAALDKREKVLQKMQTLREKNDAAVTDVQLKIFASIGSFAEDEIKIETRDGSVVVMLFDELMYAGGGQTQIKARGKEALAALNTAIATHPEMHLTVQGHTVNRGNYKNPLELSLIRAAKVAEVFNKDLGLSATNITAAGAGNTMLRFEEEKHPENKRIELIISPRFQEIYRILKKNNF